MIVDVHAHYIPKDFSDFMGDRFPTRVGVPILRGIARHPVSDSAEDIQGFEAAWNTLGEQLMMASHGRNKA